MDENFLRGTRPNEIGQTWNDARSDDDIVLRLRQMAVNHGRHRTHYDGCDQSHLECAALVACDEIERLRVERADWRAESRLWQALWEDARGG